jgi:hypothetical protein
LVSPPIDYYSAEVALAASWLIHFSYSINTPFLNLASCNVILFACFLAYVVELHILNSRVKILIVKVIRPALLKTIASKIILDNRKVNPKEKNSLGTRYLTI